jgi:hypothetical protein
MSRMVDAGSECAREFVVAMEVIFAFGRLGGQDNRKVLRWVISWSLGEKCGA